MNELLPCPFCGKNNGLTLELTPSETTRHFVMCTDCGAEGPYDLGESGAIESWNTRPVEDKLRARIAELEAGNRWIPVEERLPETPYSDIGQEVLCLVNRWGEYSVFALKYDGEGKFYSGGWGKMATDWTDRVTHWRPLPAAPEAQQ
jgi:Lar family restriction alleviation protein